MSFVHVGDSRLYLHRDGRLHKLTIDHSHGSVLIQQGADPNAVATLHDAGDLVQALGLSAEIIPGFRLTPAFGTYELQPRDTALLCSDGLTKEVREAEIATVLANEPDIQRGSGRLIEMANDRGARDNVSVIVARILGNGRLAVHGRTDVGKVRSANEDAIGFSERGRIAVVADGMGSYGFGDRASAIAVAVMLGMDPGDDPEAIDDMLRDWTPPATVSYGRPGRLATWLGALR